MKFLLILCVGFLFLPRIVYSSCQDIFADKAFQGFFEDPKKLREYRGMEGYIHFVDKQLKGDMKATSQIISKHSNHHILNKLGWSTKPFEGSITDFYIKRSQIIDAKTNKLKIKYVQMEGYASFAKKYYKGNMKEAFQDVSAVLSNKKLRRLEWKVFTDTTEMFRFLKEEISTPDKQKEYVDMHSYARFADTFYEGDMEIAFHNMLAVLSTFKKHNFQWKKFHGSTTQFHALRKKIEKFYTLTEELQEEPQNPREEVSYGDKYNQQYTPLANQIIFVEEYFGGNMSDAYRKIHTVLNKSEFEKLNWLAFEGDTFQLNLLLTDFKNHYPNGYVSSKGHRRVAKEIFNDDLNVTYKNVSLLRGFFFQNSRSNQKFRKLKWHFAQHGNKNLSARVSQKDSD